MKPSEPILAIIYDAIDEINTLYLDQAKVEKTENAVLYSAGGTLDSVGLVDLIVATEQRIQEKFGKTLILADDKAVSQERSPFKTVGAFAEYVARRLNEPVP